MHRFPWHYCSRAAALTLLIAGLLTGCAEFRSPLVARTKSAADPALNGAWQSDEDITFHIATRDSRSHAAAFVMRRPGVGLETGSFIIYPGRVASESYLSLAPTEVEGARHYYIARYSAEHDIVKLSIMRPERLRAALETGSLRGKIKDERCDFRVDPRNSRLNPGQIMGVHALNSLMNSLCRNIKQIPQITSSPEELQGFLTRESSSLFATLGSLRRIM